MSERLDLKNVRRWVVKIGSAMLTQGRGVIDQALLKEWVAQMVALRDEGKEFVVVSSGAIAIGMHALGWQTRPEDLPTLQTAAAVGQMQLARAWQEAFSVHGVEVAQVLLTHDDASDRRRYLNVRSALQRMCQLGIVPIINENDTVSFEEIRFGDNDNLGAMVANVTGAGAYLILTDQAGMFNKNPREHDDAVLLDMVDSNDEALLEMAGKTGGRLGSGGMYTKVLAAQKAARSGTHTVLAYGLAQDVISKVINGERLGTFFVAKNTPQQARKQWLGSQLQTQGKLFLDEGAKKALLASGRSLLPVGVLRVEGDFMRGELVSCCDLSGQELARGLINYNAEDCRILMGKHSHEVARLLVHGDTLIHRDNLVLV